MKTQQRRGLWISIMLVLVILFAVGLPRLSELSFLSEVQTLLEDKDQNAEDEGLIDSTETLVAEPFTVRLSDDAMAIVGVKTAELSRIEWAKELTTQAQVVDSQSLVHAHTQLLQQQSVIHVAQVAAQSAKDEYNRLQKVAGAVAKKNVNYAKADWLNKQAQLEAAKIDYQNSLLELKQRWGDKIAGWLGQSDSQFDQILNREEVLLEVGLPADFDLNDSSPVVFVSALAERWAATGTEYVSPAFVTSHLAASQTYYFLTSAKGLRPNMRLHAWVQQGNTTKSGFFIPADAIVWYAGQSWAYIEAEEGVFKRRPLVDGITRTNGVFMETGFNEGDALVVSGAQMLLSEEFRWQIHDEEDDD